MRDNMKTIFPQKALNIVSKTANPQVGAMIITLVVGLAYFNSFNGVFVFDDISSIKENDTIKYKIQVMQCSCSISLNGNLFS